MIPDTIRTLTEPEMEPVSLADAKLQLGMTADETQWDAFLVDKIGAARELVESRLGRTIYATKFRARWSKEQTELTIPRPPLLIDDNHPFTVTVDGETVPGSDLEINEDAWPATVAVSGGRTGEVVCEYWAGQLPGSRISRRLKSAMLLYVTHLFENRGVLAADATAVLPKAFETLLASESHSGGY